MTEPDRLCIICLEVLPLGVETAPSLDALAEAGGATTTTTNTTTDKPEPESDPLLNRVASLDRCDHVLHDGCIRLWAQKTNTCPICRESFRTIRVFDGVNGPAVESYEVEEKKQVAEFDPQQWLAENPEEEEQEPDVPCPVCNSTEREDVLLLCDACDAAYHTYCIGMDCIPVGNWYCIECADTFAPQEEEDEEPQQMTAPRSRSRTRRAPVPPQGNHRSSFPRTRARMRRARRQARSLDWAGPWGRFTGRVYEALQIDLDNHEGDDDALEEFRRSQQQRERDRREYQMWQQRLSIASRLGAADAFASSIPRGARQQLQHNHTSHLPQPEPVQESREELMAWGALERARQTEQSASPSGRKRRVPTASPTEPNREPERKLKRPCTRRFLPAQNEASGSASTSAPPPGPGPGPGPGPTPTPTLAAGPSSRPVENGLVSRSPPLPEAPTFLSALLKEVEASTPSDDETVKNILGRQTGDAMSPATSPSLSAQASPRALSLTPPPLMNGRPSSPPAPLSSYLEPRYAPANYSPTRQADPETRAEVNGINRVQPPEIRQPRPRRPQEIRPQRSPETSPARQQLSPEAKASINGIVRSALKTHWHAKELTTEQYSTINRDVSRKLYEEMRDPSSLDEVAKKSWEKIATKEVARAVADTKA